MYGLANCRWRINMAIAQAEASRRSGIGHESIDGTLSEPLLQFDLANELDQLHRDESWLHPAGRRSKTLVKYPDLRIVLIAMKANTRMHEHTAAGRISVHSLKGHIRLHLPEQMLDLPAGHLLALDQCVPHDVEAAEDSAFLLTLSWPPETKKEKPGTDRKKSIRGKRK
jgi:quercetin dioxygenase-like cupin family protein